MNHAGHVLTVIAAVAVTAAPALGAIDPLSRWGTPEHVGGLPPLVATSDVTTSPDGGILTVATGFSTATTVGARRIANGPWIPVTIPPSAGSPPFRVDANDVGDLVVAGQASGGQVVVVPGNASTPQGAPLTTSGSAMVAVGAAGDAAAAWADATGSLHVSLRPAGASWEAPAVLSSPLAGATIDGIDIAVGPAGQGVAVWTVRTATGEAVLASRRTGPGLWAAAHVVVQEPSSPPQDQLAIGPNGGVLAVDASGRAAVLWSKVVSATLSQVIAGSMAADGSWTVDGVVGESDRFSR